VSDNDSRNDNLREVQEGADRLAREAEGARDENERARHGGQETDYAFRLPPDMAEADRIRAGDDVALNQRQEQIAETQRRAAETLRENAERLQGTARALDRAQEAVQDNRGDLQALQQNQEEIREQMTQAREQVDSTRLPRVDRGGTDADGNERGDG
jgi:DNA repair exonuclease SbcCD ATPase subunit